MTTINNLIYLLLQTLRPQNTLFTTKAVEHGVKKTMQQYKSTLKFLERYDKGEVSRPKELAQYSSLREYIQSI